MEYNLEEKYKELTQKYKDFTPTTLAEFEQILVELNLLKPDDPSQNAQILCHGAGERGANNLNGILNESGLEIVRTHAGARNEVSSGVLSTNICANNADNNTIDTDKTFNYAAYAAVNEQGESFTIVSAIPIKLDMTKHGLNRKIALGRIIHEDSKTNNCVLDDLNIQAIPKQFILGVIKRNAMNPDSLQEFKINENFFALSEQNFTQAFWTTMIMFAQSKHGSPEQYYDEIRAMITMHKDLSNIPEYQVDAAILDTIINDPPHMDPTASNPANEPVVM